MVCSPLVRGLTLPSPRLSETSLACRICPDRQIINPAADPREIADRNFSWVLAANLHPKDPRVEIVLLMCASTKEEFISTQWAHAQISTCLKLTMMSKWRSGPDKFAERPESTLFELKALSMHFAAPRRSRFCKSQTSHRAQSPDAT